MSASLWCSQAVQHGWYERKVERAMGIEPTLFAWEARVLPLNDARELANYRHSQQAFQPKPGLFFTRTNPSLRGQRQQLPAAFKAMCHAGDGVGKFQLARQQLQRA